MEEGEGYNVSVRGSDAEFEYACTPCADEGSNQEALKYCPECKEYLCAACTKYHKKFSATKKHSLLEKDFKQHELDLEISESPEETENKCATHPNRDIEMYCHFHDMVYCTLCIAKDHRSCPDVFEIEEAITRFSVQSDEITGAEVGSVLKKLIEIKENRNENIQTVQNEKTEILTKTQETKYKLIAHVEKLAEESTKSVDDAHTNLKQELENERDTIGECISSVENCRRQLNFSEQFNKSKQFVNLKLQKGVLRAAEKLIDDTSQNESKKLTYKDNETLITQIMMATSLVEVEENICHQRKSVMLHPSFKTKQEVNVREPDDKSSCRILSICHLPDGTIVLADYNNFKVKRLDDQYTVTDHHDLDAKPTGMCCTGTNEIAVKQNNNKVQCLSVGRSMSTTRTFDIEGGIYLGLVSFAGTLWTYTGSGVNTYSKYGSLMKTLKNDSLAKELFNSTSSGFVFPVASNKLFVYVSDFDSRVVCLDISENVNTMLTDPKLEQIRAACISSYGIVFVAGYESHNIMMFGSDGKCLGELVSSDQGIKNIESMCYDEKKHNLIVVGGTNNNIVVIGLDVWWLAEEKQNGSFG